MSHEQQHRRRQLVASVLDDVARSGRPEITRQDRVVAEFGGPDGLLLAVHHTWWTAFDAHLDALLEDPPANPSAAVADLWRSLAGRHPATRALLDAHADRPALASAEDRRRRLLREAVGVDLAVRTEHPSPQRVATCPLARWRRTQAA